MLWHLLCYFKVKRRTKNTINFSSYFAWSFGLYIFFTAAWFLLRLITFWLQSFAFAGRILFLLIHSKKVLKQNSFKVHTKVLINFIIYPIIFHNIRHIPILKSLVKFVVDESLIVLYGETKKLGQNKVFVDPFQSLKTVGGRTHIARSTYRVR